jgi:hypothetical protein
VLGLPALQSQIPNRDGLKQGGFPGIVRPGENYITRKFESCGLEPLEELDLDSCDHFRGIMLSRQDSEQCLFWVLCRAAAGAKCF